MVGRHVKSVLLAVATVAIAAGCSVSGPSVSKDDVAKEISSQLSEQVGQTPDSVECPADLDAEVGKTMRCKLEADGQTYGVTVTVTKVQGSDVKFDMKVDDKPQ